VREKLYRAFVTRAGAVNEPLINKILTLKRDQAKLLGFESHAEVSLSRKMADSVAAVCGDLDIYTYVYIYVCMHVYM